MNIKNTVSLPALTIVAAFALSACGGVLPSEPEAPAVDVARFDEVRTYCGATPPTALDASQNGWVMAMGQELSSIVSASGSLSNLQSRIEMHVNLRTASDSLGDYGQPDWLMGIAFPTLLAPKSVACIRRVGNLVYPDYPVQMPGQVIDPNLKVTALAWQSYWSRAVPVDQLPGKPLDGFEFVGNFTPKDGTVYFTANKIRFPSAQNLSICYLAPNVTQWNCSQPTIADQGANWQVFIGGLKQGVYILNSN
jgi:hypothetical protein